MYKYLLALTFAFVFGLLLTVPKNPPVYENNLGNLGIGSTTPVTTTLDAVADTYVGSGQKNKNKGGSDILQLQSSGSTRSIVDFNTDPASIGIGTSSQLLSATLRVNITSNGNNWGTGRTIDVHRMIRDWVEGNGTEASSGSGSGATWNCAVDSNISNTAANCSGSDDWDMNSPSTIWNLTPTATSTITNGLSGSVDFDVTSDLESFINGSTTNFGWIIKKTNEAQTGSVTFGSRETLNKPQLIITFIP